MSSEFQHWLQGTQLEDCWRFWQSRRGENAIPIRRDIDPLNMPLRILPNLFIYERTPDARFRCRLFGSELCAKFAEDATGRYLDDMLPSNARAKRLEIFSTVLDQRRPAVYIGRLVATKREWLSFRRLLLPVSSDGAVADLIFGMVVFPSVREGESFDAHASEKVSAVAYATDEDLA
jgi:hypothetical protein